MSALEQAKELRDVIQRVHPFDFIINQRCEKLVETLEAENVVDTGSDSSPRRNRKKQDTGDGD